MPFFRVIGGAAVRIDCGVVEATDHNEAFKKAKKEFKGHDFDSSDIIGDIMCEEVVDGHEFKTEAEAKAFKPDRY